MSKKVITSEFVSHGHPDKIADQISDAILDAFLVLDSNVRAGIEVMVKDNVVVLGGEVNSTAHVDYDDVVRDVFNKIRFPESHHLNPENIKIINLIGKQSPEIHSGVDKDEDTIGAGDQGFVVGFATNETPELMPLGYYIAKKICQYVSSGLGVDFGPDVKSQVVVEYDDDNNDSVIKSILVSSMHQCSIDDARRIIRNAILNNWCGIDEKIFNKYIDGRIDITINPCGTWNIGGPISDCGVTGRKIVVDQYGGYCNVGGGAMCVDGDTEYIGEDLKWHKISEYDGGKVGQWNNGILEFVSPSAYHVNPSEKMYHFKSPNSVDMVLSENHDIVAKTSKNNIYKIKVKDVIDKISNGGNFKDTIPCTFEYYPSNEGINLTDNQIRLQVAFCADGTYDSVPGDKGRINIKKKNKIERLEWLLRETNTDYHLLDKGEYHNHYYTFVPPVPNNKSLYSIFKNANIHQLLVLANEVVRWDGGEKNGVFRTTIKEDADFIQFVFGAIYNTRPHIICDDRVGAVKKLGDKEYEIKSKCYEVLIGKIKEISFGGCKSHTQISEFDCDMMYCFTVPSGMLLLRRNDYIFVTGNCGKDMTKVDRSAAYMARYIAKNIVANGIADTAKVEIAYMIGVPEPVALNVELNRNEDKVDAIKEFILKNVDITPSGIMKRFNHSVPRYEYLARNGHYGDITNDYLHYPWEITDLKIDIS